jgi:hypothetical protein
LKEQKLNRIFLFSEEYNSFVWLPSKTGTNHCFNTLKLFGFKNHTYIEKTNIISPRNDMGYQHYPTRFPGDENYDLISTARHPYTRLVSFFKFSRCFKYKNSHSINYTMDEPLIERKLKFKNFLDGIFNNPSIIHPALKCYTSDRIPDFYLRVENLYEDYIKIPFILSSDFNLSGELEKNCLTKENQNKIDLTPWQEYFDQFVADLIYSRTEKYCELLGYDKDIWK